MTNLKRPTLRKVIYRGKKSRRKWGEEGMETCVELNGSGWKDDKGKNCFKVLSCVLAFPITRKTDKRDGERKKEREALQKY